MRSLRLVVLCTVALVSVTPRLVPQDDWKRQGFNAPAGEVYQAAKRVIAEHHDLKSSDDSHRTLRFHIGTTAWSWGYSINLTVDPTGEKTSEAWVAIERSGGPVFSWGSGKKEVKKIWKWMQDEIYKNAKNKDASTKP